MNVTGLPRAPLALMTAEARVSPSKDGRPGNAVSDPKPRTSEVAAVVSRPVALSRNFNLQFLMLQQQMQMENRQFTSLSNVMKTKHQTASAATSNVK